MPIKSTLPEELLTFLHTNFGPITRTESLSGVTGKAGTTRLTFTDNRSVIVKFSPHPGERNFYEHHAGLLRAAGVGIPVLYWSGANIDGTNWIAVEDIPKPYPQERWIGDSEQIQTLFFLHFATWGGKRPRISDTNYRPLWDDDLTHRACEWFSNKAERSEVTSRITEVQRRAQVLFEPLCCLSGDTNPTNWRVRENGGLVLIDWERSCYGHPAIDLAITIPGLGSKDGETENQLASLYITFWEDRMGHVPPQLTDLPLLIRLGKLWSVVEFLANARLTPQLYPQESVSYIVRELPKFLAL